VSLKNGEYLVDVCIFSSQRDHKRYNRGSEEAIRTISALKDVKRSSMSKSYLTFSASFSAIRISLGGSIDKLMSPPKLRKKRLLILWIMVSAI